MHADLQEHSVIYCCSDVDLHNEGVVDPSGNKGTEIELKEDREDDRNQENRVNLKESVVLG
jgi:hypothetical protein